MIFLVCNLFHAQHCLRYPQRRAGPCPTRWTGQHSRRGGYFHLITWPSGHGSSTVGQSIIQPWTYKGCSRSNASYFTLSAHKVRDGWWWYSSRGWTFPPIFHFVTMWRMAAEGQSSRMASDMEACTKQRCGTESLHVKKKNETHWRSFTSTAYRHSFITSKNVELTVATAVL